MTIQLPAIETREIVKIYPNGVRANAGVNFAAAGGEIHALVGENGAGKTTLMHIVCGLEQATSGQVLVGGHAVQIRDPRTAIRLGIGIVHQHFLLVPSFTVAENIVLGSEPQYFGLILDRRTAIARAKELAEQYSLPVAPEAPVRDLSVGMRQRVEILKALHRSVNILILDEPTATLTPRETHELFASLRSLVALGKTVIFITHKLVEVKAVSDRITVMRNGRTVGTFRTSEAEEGTLARLMVGRDVTRAIEKPAPQPGASVLEVRDLTTLPEPGHMALNNLNFEVHQGEILGVVGVEGNGQTELAEVLAGRRLPVRGVVSVNGGALPLGDPRRVREAGVAHIPEDRLLHGAAADATICDNLIMDRYYRLPFSRFGVLHIRAIREHAVGLIRIYGIGTRSGDSALRSLSGGNIQKLVIARALSTQPHLLIASQPTRGVDVGATEYIHQQIMERRSPGMAILLISADLQEVLKLADRLLVMHNGRIVAAFADPLAVDAEDLDLTMLGLRQ